MPDKALLEVDDLHVSFRVEEGMVRAVDGVSFELRAGEVLAVVGESGSGKSVTAMSLMGLTRGPNSQIEGHARLNGTDLIAASEDELRKVRAAQMAMIFQDPMTSLNPVYRVGDQITEQIHAHEDVSKDEANRRAVELLESVGIPDAPERVHAYPHEFSGGMRQRAMIAMALSLSPEILIADEPSTALDVTIQAQILRLLERLNRDRGLAVILITHDLGVVAEVADTVCVMYAGKIVEKASVSDVYESPAHPYTERLMNSIPRVNQKGGRLDPIKGAPPSLMNIPPGCPFHPRCPRARIPNPCRSEVPPLREVVTNRLSACHFAEELLAEEGVEVVAT